MSSSGRFINLKTRNQSLKVGAISPTKAPVDEGAKTKRKRTKRARRRASKRTRTAQTIVRMRMKPAIRNILT